MSLSRVQLFATLWTVAHEAPLSMGFSRQEYWSELPFPSPGDLPYPGIEPESPALQADCLPSELPGKQAINPPKRGALPRSDPYPKNPFLQGQRDSKKNPNKELSSVVI